MKHIFFSSISLLFLLFLLLLEACADSETLSLPAPDEEEGSGVYVSISVAVADSQGTQSRAISSPKPGEDGDDLQVGTGDENEVHDLNVFFFQGEVDENTGERLGINSPHADEIDIIHIAYFSDLIPEASGNITRYITPAREIDDLQIGQTYDVLVVANLGRDAEQLSGLDKNLASLRDYRVLAMSGDKEDGYHFRMASAGPEVNSIEIIPNNSPTNPSIVSVDVERLVARVDYHIEDSYPIEGTNDKVEIQGAKLVNKYLSSYVFKRVTEGTELSNASSVVYLGNEKGNDTEPASNYVVDPKTLNPPTSNIKDSYEIYFSDYSTWSSSRKWNKPSSSITSTSTQDNVIYGYLDYTSENVVSAEVASNAMSQYCTGIVFKAQYIPEGFEDKSDKSFYWYDGKAYSNLDEIDIDGLSESNYEDYGIIFYFSGICYYTYWIRHADDGNPNVISPMEYAIVRNNLYQLKVNSISGIGSVTPQDDVKVTIDVYVKNWESIDTEDVVWGDPLPIN